MEEDFLRNLNHIFTTAGFDTYNCRVDREVPPAAIFKSKLPGDDLSFFTKRFDFVIFQRRGIHERAILAIELDGPEHELEENKKRDKVKDDMAARHKLVLHRVPNLYARQYINIRDNILAEFFRKNN
jgi:hypothetical protein